MILLDCPWCGPSPETEFHFGGERPPRRPAVAEQFTAEWVAYVYLRSNPCGYTREWWYHALGCERWLLAERDTSSNRFIGPLVDAACLDPEAT